MATSTKEKLRRMVLEVMKRHDGHYINFSITDHHTAGHKQHHGKCVLRLEGSYDANPLNENGLEEGQKKLKEIARKHVQDEGLKIPLSIFA